MLISPNIRQPLIEERPQPLMTSTDQHLDIDALFVDNQTKKTVKTYSAESKIINSSLSSKLDDFENRLGIPNDSVGLDLSGEHGNRMVSSHQKLQPINLNLAGGFD